MYKSNKPGPKKSVSKIKIYEDTSGTHKVSADGSHVSIGDATFKRTVLPSVAAPKPAVEKLNEELETLDEPTINESVNSLAEANE